jgi:integrase
MAHFPKPFFKKSRGLWYVEIDRKQVNLGRDKDEAFRLYHVMMAEPRKRQTPTSTVLEVIDTYLDWCQNWRAEDTYEWYRFRLQDLAVWLQRHYPNITARDLREFHIDEWLDTFNHLSSGSRLNYCRTIKRAMRWAKKKGRIESNPIADMELPKAGKREIVVSKSEWDTLLELVSDPCFRDLVDVTWDTGCRPKESLRVEARHVDVANQRWVFPESESKTNAPRVVYLTDDALAISKRLMLLHPTGPIFRNTKGNPWKTNTVNCAFTRIQIKLGRKVLDQRSTHISADKRRRYLCVDDAAVFEFMKTLNPVKQSGRVKTKAELRNEARRKLTTCEAMKVGTKYSLYSLRHTWMNRLLTRGVDALTVAFLAGHSDPSTLANVYAHLFHDPSYLLGQAKKAAVDNGRKT